MAEADNTMTDWGVGELKTALMDVGYVPGAITIATELNPDTDRIPPVDRRAEAYSLEMDGSRIEVTGIDDPGILYGCLDAASRIRREGGIPSGIRIGEVSALTTIHARNSSDHEFLRALSLILIVTLVSASFNIWALMTKES